MIPSMTISFFFFNDTATTEIYTLSLHDALPIWDISAADAEVVDCSGTIVMPGFITTHHHQYETLRSEEHTSELQSRSDLVCRLLLEKKNNDGTHIPSPLQPPHETDHKSRTLLDQ